MQTHSFETTPTATLDEMIAQGELAAKEKERRRILCVTAFVDMIAKSTSSEDAA